MTHDNNCNQDYLIYQKYTDFQLLINSLIKLELVNRNSV